MTFPRISLALTGIVFFGFGLAFLIDPVYMGDMVDLGVKGQRKAIEIRAMYGGLEIGLGMFFLVATLRIRWIRAALGAQVATFAGLALARLVGMVISGRDNLMLTLAAIEIGGALMGWIAFRRAGAAFMAGRVDPERANG